MEFPTAVDYYHYELRMCFMLPKFPVLVIALLSPFLNVFSDEDEDEEGITMLNPYRGTLLAGILTFMIGLVRDYAFLSTVQPANVIGARLTAIFITFVTVLSVGLWISSLVLVEGARHAGDLLPDHPVHFAISWFISHYMTYTDSICFFRFLWLFSILICRIITFVILTFIQDVKLLFGK